MDSHISNLLQLQDGGEEMMLNDFMQKRAQLVNDLMRTLSAKCASHCLQYNDQAKLNITENEQVVIPDITTLE